MRRVTCSASPSRPERRWISASCRASVRSTACMSLCSAAVAITNTVANSTPAETDEQAGIDQRQPEGGRAQDPSQGSE